MSRKDRRAAGKGGTAVSAANVVQAKRLFAEAVTRHSRGELEAAVAAYRQVLAVAPGFAEAYNNLGSALLALRQDKDACAAYRRAVSLNPTYAEAYANLGAALVRLGTFAEADAACQKAITLKPDWPDGHGTLGAALLRLGRHGEAVAALQRAISLRADYADAHANLGAAFVRMERFEEAIAACRKAVALQPDHADAYANLGGAYVRLERFDEAIAACRKAVALRPAHADAHASLGAALFRVEQFDAAHAACRMAIALQPDHADAHSNLAAVLRRLGRRDEAIAAALQAIALRPDHAGAHMNLAGAYVGLGRMDEAMRCMETAVRLNPQDVNLFRTLLLTGLYRDDIGADELRRLHLRFGAAFARQARPLPQRDLSPGRPLRVGYMSSDLRRHPVASNLLPVVRNHDREAYSLHFYVNMVSSDEVTAEFRALADDWHDIVGLTDEAVAERIRADGIDILVSLAGRFDENRPQICAWRAAPVQISMHDVATSGLSEIDYLVADPWLFPRGCTEYFSERALRLPHFYIADVPAALPETCDSRMGPPVFGCFNNPDKITSSVLQLWGRILAAIPESTLRLKYRWDYQSDSVRSHFLHGLTAAGAEAHQVVFVTDGVSSADFLRLYNDVDVALDTFPFSGSTTTFQALCMGVPVVTWPWDRMVGRWTASMLHALDLSTLIATSGDDYVRLALEVAGDAGVWRLRRGQIRDRLVRSTLCDPTRWTRNLERLYRAVWRRYCRAQDHCSKSNQ